ncbi:MAG: hypothetical protein FJZ57_08685 [Chlamydiae bacterium]|nr:hypothetical protein [Chlamydiota bacterium]
MIVDRLSSYLRTGSCIASSFLKGYVSDCLYIAYPSQEKPSLANKICFVFKTCTLPLQLVLYGAAIVFDNIATKLSSRTYYKLEGQLNTVAGEMTIYSCNISMLDYGISAIDGLSRPSERISAVAKKILSSNATVICLQEVSFYHAKLLWQELKKEYCQGYTRTVDVMPYSLIDSGLFIASKVPIQQIRYFSLSNSGFIPRGVVAVCYEDYWILNTHLSSKDKLERKQQFQELINICNSLCQEKNVPCFVCMDGNIERTADPYDEFSSLDVNEFFLLPQSDNEGFSVSLENATAVDSFLKDNPKPIYIDYVLCYRPSAQHVEFSTQLDRLFSFDESLLRLSDHHAIVAKIEII